MSKAELKAREAELRANDIAEANRESGRENAISRLMLSGMRRSDAVQAFNEQVAYFMRGIDGYNRAGAIDAAIDVILNGCDEVDEVMLDLVYC